MKALSPLGLSVPAFDRYRIHLRLTRPVRFGFEHGGVLRGLLSAALRQHALPRGVIPFAPESGRVLFDAGEGYAFGLTLVGEARSLAQPLRDGLARLGQPQPSGGPAVLGGNFVLESWHLLNPPDLEAEVDALDGGPIHLQWLSPLRLDRPSSLRQRGAGYVNRDCFPLDWFLERLRRRLAELAELPVSPEPGPSYGADLHVEHLQWIDMPVPGNRFKARPYTLGGVRGRLRIDGLDPAWRAALVLGAHLQVGQKTHFGFGRYAVGPAAAIGTCSGALSFNRHTSLVELASRPENLEQAADRVYADLGSRGQLGHHVYSSEPNLDRLSHQLRSGAYRPPLLKGIAPHPGAEVPPTAAAPNLRDRIAQQAVAQVLGNALDTWLEQSSVAFRRGFSRQGAAKEAQWLHERGFRRVVHTDLAAFYSAVEWSRLIARLRALYPVDPLIDLVEAWVRAPLEMSDQVIERQKGLPYGPLAPVLVGLCLDVLDDGLREAGLRLVRRDNVFVVMGRVSRSQLQEVDTPAVRKVS